MKRAAVRAGPVPEGGLAAAAFPGVDYADAYAVGLPPDVSARSFAEAVFASSPRWVSGLMALRNTIVRSRTTTRFIQQQRELPR